MDGKTSGPSILTGTIGKQLQKCEEIDIDEGCLGTDQKYVLKIYQAVSYGDYSDQMAPHNPGIEDASCTLVDTIYCNWDTECWMIIITIAVYTESLHASLVCN